MVRAFRWLLAVGAGVAAFGLAWWAAEGWFHLDRSTSLTLATAAGSLLATPVGWWATQQPGPSRRRTSAPAVTPNSYLFICYSHRDGGHYARRLARVLTDLSISVWLDQEIPYGSQLSKVIQQRIDECAALVVLMTPGADESAWVDLEIARARFKGKPLVPFLVAGAPLFSLANVKYVDVTDGRMPAGTEIDRLRALAGDSRVPPAASQTSASLTPNSDTSAPSAATLSAPHLAGDTRARSAITGTILLVVTAILLYTSGDSTDPAAHPVQTRSSQTAPVTPPFTPSALATAVTSPSSISDARTAANRAEFRDTGLADMAGRWLPLFRECRGQMTNPGWSDGVQCMMDDPSLPGFKDPRSREFTVMFASTSKGTSARQQMWCGNLPRTPGVRTSKVDLPGSSGSRGGFYCEDSGFSGTGRSGSDFLSFGISWTSGDDRYVVHLQIYGYFPYEGKDFVITQEMIDYTRGVWDKYA